MEQALMEYVSACVIGDIRADKPLDDKVAHACNSRPLVDFLRAQVTAGDTLKLMALADQDQAGLCGLALSLLKTIDTSAEIERFLRDLWRRRPAFITRQSIMWRLLDFPNIELEFHEEMYRFVRENWIEFVGVQTHFLGGTQGQAGVLSAVVGRLADSDSPRTKDWAYLCALAGSDDRGGCRAVIERYVTSDVSIVARVANDLLTVSWPTIPSS